MGLVSLRLDTIGLVTEFKLNLSISATGYGASSITIGTLDSYNITEKRLCTTPFFL